DLPWQSAYRNPHRSSARQARSRSVHSGEAAITAVDVSDHQTVRSPWTKGVPGGTRDVPKVGPRYALCRQYYTLFSYSPGLHEHGRPQFFPVGRIVGPAYRSEPSYRASHDPRSVRHLPSPDQAAWIFLHRWLRECRSAPPVQDAM